MFEGSGYEHIVKQNTEGTLFWRKVGLILAYIIIFTLPTFLILMLCPPFFYVPFILVIITLTVIAYLLTWKYTNVEFEYSIFGDTISFVSIYGKRSRKGKLDICIKDFTEIGKYTDSAEKHLDEVIIEKDHLFISGLEAEHIYYGIFEDGGEKSIVYFECTDKALALLKKYNPSAIRKAEREADKYRSVRSETPKEETDI